jgi:hypothetical protein
MNLRSRVHIVTTQILWRTITCELRKLISDSIIELDLLAHPFYVSWLAFVLELLSLIEAFCVTKGARSRGAIPVKRVGKRRLALRTFYWVREYL